MTEHFKHVKGGFSSYLAGDDVEITDCRFVLAHFSEDAEKVIEALGKGVGETFSSFHCLLMEQCQGVSFAPKRVCWRHCAV